MWLLSHAVYAITSYHQYKSACIAVFCVLSCLSCTLLSIYIFVVIRPSVHGARLLQCPIIAAVTWHNKDGTLSPLFQDILWSLNVGPDVVCWEYLYNYTCKQSIITSCMQLRHSNPPHQGCSDTYNGVCAIYVDSRF